jgi:hypothetical protein
MRRIQVYKLFSKEEFLELVKNSSLITYIIKGLRAFPIIVLYPNSINNFYQKYNKLKGDNAELEYAFKQSEMTEARWASMNLSYYSSLFWEDKTMPKKIIKEENRDCHVKAGRVGVTLSLFKNKRSNKIFQTQETGDAQR